MGAYIDMEIPTSCGDCRFCGEIADTDCGPCARCDVDGKDRDAYTRQDCPLIEVPEPHGRLIDADALLKDAEVPAILYPYKRRDIEIHTHAVALGDVMNAPTVIPASKEAE